MEFRQRCGLLLEAALRTAVALRSARLMGTIVEAVSMFKIGCKSTGPDDVEWFDGVIMRQYDCLPRVTIENTKVECSGEDDMATCDTLTLSLDFTREHAEQFTKAKLALCKKQGIPPQLALQAYREAWWFIIRAERQDGDETPDLKVNVEGLLQSTASEDVAKFDGAPFEERVLTAWPMVVQNITQKSGTVKIQFPAPSVAGKYRFTASVKSQDYLGADQEFSVEATILGASSVVRKPEAPNGDSEGDEETDEGAKKDQ